MKKNLHIRKTILALTLLLVCGICFGQSEIVGTVNSNITNAKPNSNIYVELLSDEDLKLDKVFLSIKDTLNSFIFKNLEPNQLYKIKVSAFGYDDQIFDINTINGTVKADLIIKGVCGFVSLKTAERDWNRKKAKLYLVSGISSIGNSKTDKIFEKKYKIKYYDFGDTVPNMECIQVYNERIFKLMDEKYGTEWRKKVRSDVEYLK